MSFKLRLFKGCSKTALKYSLVFLLLKWLKKQINVIHSIFSKYLGERLGNPPLFFCHFEMKTNHTFCWVFAFIPVTHLSYNWTFLNQIWQQGQLNSHLNSSSFCENSWVGRGERSLQRAESYNRRSFIWCFLSSDSKSITKYEPRKKYFCYFWCSCNIYFSSVFSWWQ